MIDVIEKDFTFDIIWNMTLICAWDCPFCCVDAVHVKRSKESIILRESYLTKISKIEISNMDTNSYAFHVLCKEGKKPNIYDFALSYRQGMEIELSYERKIKVLNNLLPYSVDIDFSGGDPLLCYENFLVIKEASKLFGRNHISITATGASIAERYTIDDIASVIGKLGFTFDEPILDKPDKRPVGYNAKNLAFARQISEKGIRTVAQLPLHSGNFSNAKIESIYNALNRNGITEVHLMRTFPVGRGADECIKQSTLTPSTYLKVIDQYRQLEHQLGSPKVTLQCALKHLDGNNSKNPCDLVFKSFGINPKGILLSSAWATSGNGEPLADLFCLGDLSKTSLSDIVHSDRLREYRKRLDDNFGHCKIFCFFYSPIKDFNSLFLKNDPLYKDL